VSISEQASTSLTSGHPGIGVGSTVEYHFDGTSSTRIGVLTWTWDRDRFEFSAFRFLDVQVQGLKTPNKGQDLVTIAYVF
jgi:hypothetical protein